MVGGFRHGARVVTAAALIMSSVFGSFILGGDPIIKRIGFALAFGVLFDAFVVRMTIVPAVMALLGERAWYLPRWLDRLLPDVDIEGSELREYTSHGWTTGLDHDRARRRLRAAATRSPHPPATRAGSWGPVDAEGGTWSTTTRTHPVPTPTDACCSAPSALIVAFMAGEVVVGLLVDSLALLADAGHMLTDAAAIGLALVAMRLAARPASGAYTFGLKRAEILSAQINGLTLAVLVRRVRRRGRTTAHPPTRGATAERWPWSQPSASW